MEEFVPQTVLKSDVLSQTQTGHVAGTPDTRVVHRRVAHAPLWSRPLAWYLARREIRALRALDGLECVPALIATDDKGLYRSWVDGTPLHLARPADGQWYRDAHRLLRALHARNVTHNDLAKPQNWLVTPDGRAALIDFQLASVFRRRNRLARLLAYEDVRHLLKQKRSYARHLVTPFERRVLKRKSLPARIWMRTGKVAYNFVTRSMMNWSDGEGTGDRIDREGPAIRTTLDGLDGIGGSALLTYPLRAQGVGLYLFVETQRPEDALRKALAGHAVNALQTVAALPRGDDGTVRSDLLHLVANNRIDELDAKLAANPDLGAAMGPIIDGRKSFSDRQLTNRRRKPAKR